MLLWDLDYTQRLKFYILGESRHACSSYCEIRLNLLENCMQRPQRLAFKATNRIKKGPNDFHRDGKHRKMENLEFRDFWGLLGNSRGA